MCCKKFKEQSEMENREMISKIAHLARESDTYFTALSSLIRQAENEGLFDKVKIGLKETHPIK